MPLRLLNLFWGGKIIIKLCYSGTITEWVRASALSHSEWMVPRSKPGKGRNYFCSRVGNGGVRVTCIDGYVIATSTKQYMEAAHRGPLIVFFMLLPARHGRSLMY